MNLTFIPIVIFVLGCVFLVRNNMVYGYLMRMTRKVSDREDWKEKKQFLREEIYMEMLWKFWRSFDSFFPEELTKK